MSAPRSSISARTRRCTVRSPIPSLPGDRLVGHAGEEHGEQVTTLVGAGSGPTEERDGPLPLLLEQADQPVQQRRGADHQCVVDDPGRDRHHRPPAVHQQELDRQLRQHPGILAGFDPAPHLLEPAGRVQAGPLVHGPVGDAAPQRAVLGRPGLVLGVRRLVEDADLVAGLGVQLLDPLGDRVPAVQRLHQMGVGIGGRLAALVGVHVVPDRPLERAQPAFAVLDQRADRHVRWRCHPALRRAGQRGDEAEAVERGQAPADLGRRAAQPGRQVTHGRVGLPQHALVQLLIVGFDSELLEQNSRSSPL